MAKRMELIVSRASNSGGVVMASGFYSIKPSRRWAELKLLDDNERMNVKRLNEKRNKGAANMTY